MTLSSIHKLRHHRLQLALHRLLDREGPPLLLLHGLGERSPETLPVRYAAWPGPVFALDFTGHGVSDVPRGGGYSCETLLADADAALAHLETCTVAGRGIGGYVALMLAGARPEAVRGALILDGPGLTGGGTTSSPSMPVPDMSQSVPPDPYAIADLSHDVRPPGYAASFAMLAAQQSPLEAPVAVCARERPAWLLAVTEMLSLETVPLELALRRYGDAALAGAREGRASR
ncbi:alpha/beta fold hydrolase [Paracidovorax citrulli]